MKNFKDEVKMLTAAQEELTASVSQQADSGFRRLLEKLPVASAYFSSKYRILVVDDNRDAAISLGMMLKIMGHDTRTAFDGLEALEAAKTFLPNVIILDIGLPKLNGYDVCSRIRREVWGKEIVLIALTGWSQEDDKCQSKEAGFNFHMLKPVDPQALVKLLAGLLLTPA